MVYIHNNLSDWQKSPITAQFYSQAREIARVTPDGIFQFQIAANDENAKLFVECVERYIAKRAITGLDVTVVETSPSTEKDAANQAAGDALAVERWAE